MENSEPKPQPNRPWLAPPWDSAAAKEAAARSAAVRKGRKWTWDQRASHVLRKRTPSGLRTHDELIGALVREGMEGNVAAIELLAKFTGWQPSQRREVVNLERRQLVILPSSDPRAEALASPQVVDAQAVTTDQPPCAPYVPLSDAGQAQSSQVHVAQGDTSDDAQGDNDDAGGSEGQGGA